ncbi:DUF167 domain-containing protein [Thiolapillus brandeum]|uniref:UPF0235 protein TBH_C2607 n=1 Tax=Thiolapillus brandeum TaxID=1076588 RepID=A0A7U6GKZ3_9GAMM|nr:DUF167 family protein [Thiolapillus brandeum]BAO45513.1 conserved hypothetical protein [Thiolapillus brandeum]
MSSSWYRTDGEDLLLFIRVQPRSSKDGFAEVMENVRKLRIKAAPVDGKANNHLIRYLSKRLGIPKSRIQVETGHTSRNKRIRLKGLHKLPDDLD